MYDDNEEPITYDDDPIEYLHRQNQGHEQAIGQLSQLANAYATQRHVDQAETRIRRDRPYYDHAEQYLTSQIAKEAASLGSSNDEAIAFAQHNVMQAKANVSGRGLDPAEYVYEMSKIRGYNAGMGIDKMNDNELDSVLSKCG